MDNLETILDTAVRDFLAQITSQSKVLITSRVGLGELEYRFPLRAMKDEEAVSLLRATAQVRRVEQLVRTSNTDLKIYCRKMKNNALFIKWFVSSVQSGRRPEETLQNSSILLEYCLSNVVEHLSDDARLLARAMVGIPGPHAQPVLAYLTDLDGERLQLALQQLVTANVAVLTAQPTSSGYESLYDLGNLPKLYLLKSLPPSAEEMAAFGKRHSDLAMAHEQIRARATASPYSPNSVAIRTKDDVVVAKYLTDALYAVWQKRFEQADTLVERAKGISPNYSEIYRVEGWYQYFAGNFAAARNAYETAIELNPHSPYIRYWYAGFLLRAQRDTEAAVKQLAVARELDPNSAEVRVEYARGLAFLFRFDQADEELRPVIEGAHVTKLMRVAYDGWMQIAVRRGYFAVDSNDYLSALSAFQNAVQRFHSIPGEYRDRRIIESILHCLPVARRTLDELFHSDRAEAAEKLIARIEAIGSSIAADDPLGTPHTGAPPMHLKFGETGLGEISYVNTVSKFGFIRVDGGGDLFFHQNHLKPPVPIRYRSLGERVRFVVGENQHGLTAEKVEILTPDKEPKTLGNQMFGVVDRIFPEKSFGFIRSDDGMEIFFHRTELMTQGQNISRLPPGTRVRFILSRNDKGLIAKSIERSLEQLHNLIEVGQRVTGKVRARRRGTSYAFVDIGADRDVLIRSQDFREPGEWERVVDGDVVSFTVTQGKERENYNSVDIIVEHKF